MCFISCLQFFINLLLKILRFIVNTLKTLPRDIRALYRLQKLKFWLSFSQWSDVNVGDLFDCTVRRNPEKICFYFKDQKWSFINAYKYANKVGNYFQARGYQKGDCVALMMSNKPEFIFLWLGLSKIGVITSWININLRHQSLAHCIRRGNSKALIFEEECLDSVLEIYGEEGLPSGITWFCLEKSENQILLQSTHLTEAERFQPVELLPDLLDCSSANPIPVEKIKFEDTFCYIFTSGTTGLPKAAIVTHSRVISMTYGPHYMIGLNNQDILYTPLPLYHVQGGICGVGQALFFGMSQVLVKKFSASRFWKDCVRYNVTVSQYLGEICRYLLNQPSIREERIHFVKKIFGNGMKPEIWNTFLNRFNRPHINELYGATEGNCQMANFEGIVGICGSTPYGIIGRLLPASMGLYKVDEETGQLARDPITEFAVPCKVNECGELLGLIVNDSPMRAFHGYRDPDATTSKIACNVRREGDRYFKSGDLMFLDELNYYHFVDRLGSSFRWKGENVSSEEVASIICSSIGLSDVVVFGVEVPHTDGKAGMAVISFTCLNTKTQLSSVTNLIERLSTCVENLLPSYARPIFVRFVETINCTGTYKLQKFSLQNEGYDISVLKEPIFCMCDGKYVPLTNELYSDILQGNIRF